MTGEQLQLFGFHETHPATWTPRELWLRLHGVNVSSFGEDKRLERKSAKRIDYDAFAEYLSMWSNTVDGGIMLYGVENNGVITGCSSLTGEQINRLESAHTRSCPDANPNFKNLAVTVHGKPDFIIAVFVPYRGFLVETNKHEAFIRRGDQKHRMTAEERDDFKSTRHERSWEQRASGNYRWPADFDSGVIDELCSNFRLREGKDWTDEAVLVDRHLLLEGDSGLEATNALVLLAAKNPRASHPGARVRVLRFEGREEGSGNSFQPLKDIYIEGNLPAIAAKASQIVGDLCFNVTWLGRDGKFVTTPEYPKWAWFEAIVNALVHRSYSFSGSETTVKFFSDRLEIESPGGFVPPVTPENVYHQRASRNPHIMEALRYVGLTLMNREGTRRMRESMEQFNLPAPTFTQEVMHGVSVRVTLHNEHQNRKRSTDRDVAAYCGVELWKQLQEHEIQIVGYAFNNGVIQVAEAARLTGRQWNSSKKDLDKLVQKGLLVFHAGKMQRDPKTHYSIVTGKVLHGH